MRLLKKIFSLFSSRKQVVSHLADLAVQSTTDWSQVPKFTVVQEEVMQDWLEEIKPPPIPTQP